MSSRLRNLDSKISFFAFADIITAVSGVLIFVALLLATDLGRPTENRSQTTNSANERQLHEILAEQVEVDASNQSLEELLAAAEAAPDNDKLQADITRLRGQLSLEQLKQASFADQLAASQATIAARDEVLGLTELKASVERKIQETKAIANQDTLARSNMDNLEQEVAQVESQLLKLRQRDGQIWLIPEKSATSKEPILVTVAGAGVTIDQFDHPDQRRQLEKSGVDTAFESYLHKANSLNQYVVFLIRPSGIGIFQDLVKSARDNGFDVGFDALEEDRQVHFSTPPPIDEAPPPTNAPASATSASSPAVNSNFASPTKTTPVAAASSTNNLPSVSTTAPAKVKSWWQKLLEWVGLK